MASGVNIWDLAAKITADTKDAEGAITATQKKVLDLADKFKKVDTAAATSGKKIAAGMQQAHAPTKQLSSAFQGLTQATSALDGPLGGISGRLSSIAQIGAGVTSSAGAIGVAIGALAAITAGAAIGIYKLVTASAEATGHLFDLSQRTNFSVETLSALQHAAETSGGSIETISVALGIFQKNQEEAATGNEELSRLFKALSIDINDNEKALRQAFLVLSSMESGAQQTALSMKLFGRSGREVMAVFKEAGGDLDAFINKLRGEGLLVTGEMAKSGDRLSDSITRIGQQFSAIGRQVASEFAPMVENALTNFSRWLRDNSSNLKDVAANVASLITWASRLNEILAMLTFKPFVVQVQLVASMIGEGWKWLGLGKLAPPPGHASGGRDPRDITGFDPNTGKAIWKAPPDTYRDPREAVGGTWGQRPDYGLSKRARDAMAGGGGGRGGGGGGGGRAAKDLLEPYKRILADLETQMKFYGETTEKARVEQQFLQAGIEKLNPKLKAQAEAIRDAALALAASKDKAKAYAEAHQQLEDVMNGWLNRITAAKNGWDSYQIKIEEVMARLKDLTPLQQFAIRMDLETEAAKQRAIDAYEKEAEAIKKLTRAWSVYNSTRPRRTGVPENEEVYIDEAGRVIDRRPKGVTAEQDADRTRPRRVDYDPYMDEWNRMRDRAEALTSLIRDSIDTGFRDGMKAGLVRFAQGLLDMIQSKLWAKIADSLADALMGGGSKGGGGGWMSKIIGILLGGIAGGFGGGGSGPKTPTPNFPLPPLPPLPAFADGGFMAAHKWAIVGERGPELIKAGRQGATVVPSHALGGHTFNININVPNAAAAGSRETQRQVSEQYRRLMQKHALSG